MLTAGVAACGAAIVNPEALRHGLQFVYGWIPFAPRSGRSCCSCARAGGRSRERDDLRLAAVIALAVVAATAYNGFYLHALRPQMAVYYAPLIAIFLAELHLRLLGRTRPVALLGAAWLTFLVGAGVGLTLKDARAESVTVSGAEGSLAETPTEAHLYDRPRRDRARDGAGRAHPRAAAPDGPRGALRPRAGAPRGLGAPGRSSAQAASRTRSRTSTAIRFGWS